MKRWIGSLALACVAGAAFAQAPFTIVRPADESKVREKVRIEIYRGTSRRTVDVVLGRQPSSPNG